MTPAIRAAEAGGVPLTLHRYEHDARAGPFGLEAVEKLGVTPERVFKTLIAEVDGKRLVMAVLPAARRLDLKKLAAAAGGKKADMTDPAAAERATGYVLGGVSPLGGKRTLAVFVDESARRHPTIYVSAGRRGLQLELAPADLIHLTAATMADLGVA
ncbi:MAG TPA: Cys-tRNA(Pro) deacylase [Gemmataceae bacterium]|nr:Cys-tRNA(Pro) deacylase [Gemmataceae bacterium]